MESSFPGVNPRSGRSKVPCVGVQGNGDPEIGVESDIDASIPTPLQSSAIRAWAACNADSSLDICAFS